MFVPLDILDPTAIRSQRQHVLRPILVPTVPPVLWTPAATLATVATAAVASMVNSVKLGELSVLPAKIHAGMEPHA